MGFLEPCVVTSGFKITRLKIYNNIGEDEILDLESLDLVLGLGSRGRV